MPVIAAGGVSVTRAASWRPWRSGASAVQIGSAYLYCPEVEGAASAPRRAQGRRATTARSSPMS